jgi:hypothetical protein
MKVVPPPVLLGEPCSIPHNQSPFYILFMLISEIDSLTAILTEAHEFKSASYTPVPLILFHKVAKHPKSHNHQIQVSVCLATFPLQHSEDPCWTPPNLSSCPSSWGLD